MTCHDKRSCGSILEIVHRMVAVVSKMLTHGKMLPLEDQDYSNPPILSILRISLWSIPMLVVYRTVQYPFTKPQTWTIYIEATTAAAVSTSNVAVHKFLVPIAGCVGRVQNFRPRSALKPKNKTSVSVDFVNLSVFQKNGTQSAREIQQTTKRTLTASS